MNQQPADRLDWIGEKRYEPQKTLTMVAPAWFLTHVFDCLRGHHIQTKVILFASQCNQSTIVVIAERPSADRFVHP